jgi:hypothetical protein
MTSNLHATAVFLSALSLALVAACGDDEPEPAAIAATTANPATAASAAVALPGAVVRYSGDFASPYCVSARDWAAHEVVEHDWSGPPESNEAYWQEYTAFAETAYAVAPADIAGDWDIYVAGKAEQGTVLEKYAFDGERFEAEATDAERTILDGPYGELRRAIDNVLRYEAEVCHTSFLTAADVTYTGDPNSDYCQLLDELPPAGSPSAIEEFFASGAADEYYSDLIEAAPAEIKADQETLVHWDEEWAPKVLGSHGWDFRRLLRQGTEEELAAIFHATPEVRDADARQTAYSEQVCE